MPKRIYSSHTIRIAAPVSLCQRFFTPAGEELWVPSWRPDYLHPPGGETRQEMIFTTGEAAEHTIWSLVDYRTDPPLARYSRVTPGSRTGFVEVRCRADHAGTAVTIRYALTALSDAGSHALLAYQGPAYVAMIEEWRTLIESKLPELLQARIR